MMSKEERLKYAYTYMKFKDTDLLLDFWQDQYVRSASRFIGIVKSRRVGWSFICALKAVVKAMDSDRIAYTKQFVSYNERDAMEKINYALQFYDSIPQYARKKIVVNNKNELDFLDTNGKTVSRLISIPCRVPRGLGGDLSLDEYAFYTPKMSDAIYTAALPVISRGGCIEMGSSPFGKIGQFYDILTDGDTYKEYERYCVAWWFCRDLCVNVSEAVRIAPNMTTEERVVMFGTDILKGIYASMNIDQFRQEYECAFIDEAASYIPLELIWENTVGRMNEEKNIELANDTSVSDEEYYNSLHDELVVYHDVDSAISGYNAKVYGDVLYLGYDVGRTHDATSIYIIGAWKGKKKSFARIEMKNTEFETQKEAILKLFQNLPIQRGCMDSTGIGRPIFEELNRRLGDRLEGVVFTMESKEILAMGVKRGLENHEYLLENAKDFHAQIHSIKRSAAIGKHFRYDAERNESGHADSFWAWALASHAVSTRRNFYAQHAENKAKKAVGETISRPRGKSLDSVLRGFGYKR